MPPYQHFIQFQQQFKAVPKLVVAGQFSTRQIADKTDVANAIVTRGIGDFKNQVHNIKSAKIEGLWCFRLQRSSWEHSINLAKAGKP